MPPMIRHRYTPGFLRAWDKYPKYKQRSSKIEAFRVWKRLKLEPDTDRVCLWINALDVDPEYAKGFASYLRKTDFHDDPPAPQDYAKLDQLDQRDNRNPYRIPTREEFDEMQPPEWEPK